MRLQFLAAEQAVIHRLLKVRANGWDDLNRFLDDLLRYGNYRLNLSVGKIK